MPKLYAIISIVSINSKNKKLHADLNSDMQLSHWVICLQRILINRRRGNADAP